MELRCGDHVRYLGPPLVGSGVPDVNIPDLRPGAEGKVVDVAANGLMVIAWRDAATMVHESAEHLVRVPSV